MLSLVADYDTSSSNTQEENTDSDDAVEKELDKKNLTSAKLSTPLLPSANMLLGAGSSKLSGEVFNNPFLEAEKLEVDKLQKHVKMVESESHLLEKNGKKICWNNRKGRCRFGNKCKYAHDSDLVESKDIADVNRQILNKLGTLDHTNIFDSNTESDCTQKSKSRKRPGLGDSIVPGKKVLKTYHSMKKSAK